MCKLCLEGGDGSNLAQGWRVGDSTRRLIYNLLRSPAALWDALKECYNESKPEHAG